MFLLYRFRRFLILNAHHVHHHTFQPGVQSRHEWRERAARSGPVIITDLGRPAHVLLTIEQYQQLAGGQSTLRDALAQRGGHDVDFDPPRLGDDLFSSADLT